MLVALRYIASSIASSSLSNGTSSIANILTRYKYINILYVRKLTK